MDKGNAVNPRRCYYEVWDKESRQMVYCGGKAVDTLAVGMYENTDYKIGGINGLTPLCEEHLAQVRLALFNRRVVE